MRDADATRRAILDAARGVFAAAGPGATHVRAIARVAGCNVERIYYYYGDKGALFVATVQDAVRQLATACADPDSATGWFQAAAEHPEAARLLLWSGLTGDSEAIRELAGAGGAGRAALIVHAIAWAAFLDLDLQGSQTYRQALEAIGRGGGGPPPDPPPPPGLGR
jgi:AcrR family transcriptional regulator